MNATQVLNFSAITSTSFQGGCSNCGYGITANHRCPYCLVENTSQYRIVRDKRPGRRSWLLHSQGDRPIKVYFSDDRYGSKGKSLSAAMLHKNALESSKNPDPLLRRNPVSGISGVGKRVIRGKNYWVSFRRTPGGIQTKHFPVSRHGEKGARSLAIAQKEQWNGVENATAEEVSRRQFERGEFEHPGASTFYEDQHHKIIQIGGPGKELSDAVDAACKYGSSTKWCTRRPHNAKSYLGLGPLYVLFSKEGGILRKKAQLHISAPPLGGVDFTNEKNKHVTTPEHEHLLVKSGLLPPLAARLLTHRGETLHDLVNEYDENPNLKETNRAIYKSFLAHKLEKEHGSHDPATLTAHKKAASAHDDAEFESRLNHEDATHSTSHPEMMSVWADMIDTHRATRLYHEAKARGESVENSTLLDPEVASGLNEHFRSMVGDLLHSGKFTHPANREEAERIVAGEHPFNYAGSLTAAATKGWARLRGQDAEHAIHQVHGDIWQRLLGKHNYEGKTWEDRVPHSAQRAGIGGTIHSYAMMLAGPYADKLQRRRLQKRLAKKISEPLETLRGHDPAASRTGHSNNMEYHETATKILNNLKNRIEEARGGKDIQRSHYKRVRKLEIAHQAAQKMIENPGMAAHEAISDLNIPEIGRHKGALVRPEHIIDLIRLAAEDV